MLPATNKSRQSVLLFSTVTEGAATASVRRIGLARNHRGPTPSAPGASRGCGPERALGRPLKRGHGRSPPVGTYAACSSSRSPSSSAAGISWPESHVGRTAAAAAARTRAGNVREAGRGCRRAAGGSRCAAARSPRRPRRPRGPPGTAGPRARAARRGRPCPGLAGRCAGSGSGDLAGGHGRASSCLPILPAAACYPAGSAPRPGAGGPGAPPLLPPASPCLGRLGLRAPGWLLLPAACRPRAPPREPRRTPAGAPASPSSRGRATSNAASSPPRPVPATEHAQSCPPPPPTSFNVQNEVLRVCEEEIGGSCFVWQSEPKGYWVR